MTNPADDLVPSPVTQGEAGAISRTGSAGRFRLSRRSIDGFMLADDHDLDRPVSLRTAGLGTPEAEALEREARFSARLDHACLPVVHEVVHSEDGLVVVGKAIEGITLEEAAGQAAAGLPPPELATVMSTVDVLIKVCDGLASAHARRVIHRKVRPECIVLGWFGQVFIIDWAASAKAAERPMTLRYVAAVTAPAVCDMDDLHADIRAIGACLFTALGWRPLSGDLDTAMDGLDAVGRSRIPPMLAAIIRRALTTDGAGGYRSVVEIAQDLRRFLEGQAPQAFSAGWLSKVGLAIRRRAWVYAAAGLLAVLAAGVWSKYGSELQDSLAWGQPVVSESFSDEEWKSRWQMVDPQSFEVRDGKLVSVAKQAAYAIYRTRLTTPLQVTYTGEIPPGTIPGDLSLQWCESETELSDPSPLLGSSVSRQYLFQAGAYQNSYCSIYKQPGYQRVSYSGRHLESGTKHQFCVLIEAERLAMYIDGELVTEYRDQFPPTAGYLTLYGYYPGKTFDDVRIYQRRIPELISPIAVGDRLFQLGNYSEAAASYDQVLSSHRGRPVADLAQFRKGLCERRLGRKDQAYTTWSTLEDAELRAKAEAFRVQDHFDLNDFATVFTLFESQYLARPTIREELRRQWLGFCNGLWWRPQITNPDALAKRLLELRDKLFPDDANTQFIAANELIRQGRASEALQRFPNDRWAVANARLALGQTQELLAQPWLPFDLQIAALEMLGDYTRLADMETASTDQRARSLCKLGRAEEALTRFGPLNVVRLYLGRADEVIADPKADGNWLNAALVVTGRLTEAAGDGLPGRKDTGKDSTALLILGRLAEEERTLPVGRVSSHSFASARLISAIATGDRELIRRQAAATTLRAANGWFFPLVVVPLLDRLLGDPTAVIPPAAATSADSLRGSFAGRATAVVTAVFGASASEPIESLPAVCERPAWSHLVAGLRAELRGDVLAAVEAYRAFTGLPLHQRLLTANNLDGEVEWFVAWRLKTLAP